MVFQCLIKPPLKENTKPIDLKLHSDIQAVERARFAHQVCFFFFVITEHIVLNKKISLFLFFFLIGIFCVRLLGSREEEFDQAIQDGKRETTEGIHDSLVQ